MGLSLRYRCVYNEHMSNHENTTPKFCNIAKGLYGTGIIVTSNARFYEGQQVEVVIDRMAPGDWYTRELGADGELTETVNDWYPTLAAAKAALIAKAAR